MNDNLELKAISELKGCSFTIPYQQRGYKWTKDNIKKLLEDLKQFADSKEKIYCLQPIAVVKENESGNFYSVIDGQQRLTTLYLLYKYLISGDKDLTEATELFHYKYERDENEERRDFLRQVKTEDKSKIDFFYVSSAYCTIKNWFKESGNNNFEGKIKNLILAPKSDKSIQIIWYLVEREKAHETFRNINSGKIQLTNSDLIKALLLNRNNCIKNKEQIAAQFELMERQFAEDRFWFMLKKKDVEPQKGQSRLDFIFNLTVGISNSGYQLDSRKSFYELSSCNEEDLEEKWKKVRENYQRVKDIFDNPYTYHYVAFLIYCGMEFDDILKEFDDILKESKEKSKSLFCSYLKKEISKKVFPKRLEEYTYNDSKDALRRVFVLHNIETILQRYEYLKVSLNLRFSFEYFPFELLYKQTWNIEHIASHTDNDLKNENDRKDWIDSVQEDYGDNYFNDGRKIRDELEELKENLSNDEKFNKDFEAIIKTIEKETGESSFSEEEKNGIGNLVLLDEHTNKSFHNSLFPRKRKIVLIASGLRNSDDEKLNLGTVANVYVPICTQQVYTKSYNKQSNVKLNSWTRNDCETYLKDMKEKLAKYFEE